MSDQPKRKYDSTVARMAGNIAGTVLAALDRGNDRHDELPRVREVAEYAVGLARAIVAEVERTEPTHD